MQFFGTYAVPVILVLAGAAMLFSRQDLLNEFMKGAREGLATNFRILPSLVMLICATRMFGRKRRFRNAMRNVRRFFASARHSRSHAAGRFHASNLQAAPLPQ